MLLDNIVEVRFGGASAKVDKALGAAALGVVASLIEAEDEDVGAEQKAPLDPRSPRSQLREAYADLASADPTGAIVRAFVEVERWFDSVLTSNGLPIRDGARKFGSEEMSKIAVERGLLPDSAIQTVSGLSIMRDLAVHNPRDRTTVDQAREYLVLVDGALYAFDSELAKRAPGLAGKT